MRKAKVLDRRVYREGQVIFREGEQSWAAFLVESGSVDIIKKAEGTAQAKPAGTPSPKTGDADAKSAGGEK